MTETNVQSGAPETSTIVETASAARADYSLRASGSTYIERDKEAREIVDRIKKSSASVIGIAGVRGAGKSSLAKKVIGECDAVGSFTLLIPSPTDSEPKEFLLAIFQRIAEAATEKVQNIIKGTESLAELGNDQARQLRRQLLIVFTALAVLGFVGLAGAYLASTIKKSDANAALSSELTEKLNALEREQKRRAEGPKPTAPAKDQKITPAADSLPTELYVSLRDTNLQALIDKITDREHIGDAQLGRLINAFNGEIASYKKTPDFEIKYQIELAGISILLFLGTVIAAVYGLKINKKARSLRRHKIQYGLLHRCRDFREFIRYQSILASGSELGLTAKFFSGKFSSSKQLQDRPLSLPGLTATCSEFLRDVAEVFSGNVVICIDELDKITGVAELFKLLKGIKGILGQENTHFILTVSEDAMAFFNERFSHERSLVESSFEEIIYLDRLSLDVTEKVIRQSLGIRESTDNFLRNCTIQWIFAGGIPREIKRNLFTCYNRNISMSEGSSFKLWRLLYLEMLNSMLAMSTPKEAAGVEDQYKFLICIETVIDRVCSLPDVPDFHQFMSEVLGILGRHFGPEFRPLLVTHPDDPAKTTALNARHQAPSLSIYFAQLVEALIGAITLSIANNDIAVSENDAGQLDILIYVYKYIPINPRYAFYGLNRFLETKLNTLEIDLNDLLLDNRAPRLAAL
jgi:hypothetical protein